MLKGGLLSTLQDGGRTGCQQYGVPVSGVMDDYAYRMGNILVGNGREEAVIEVTMMGFAAEFLQEAVIALTGGDLTPTINGRPVEMWKSLAVSPGDKLAFQRVKSGCRSYVAVAGGFDVSKVMGSRSTYLRGGFGGFQGRALRKGDLMKIGIPEGAQDKCKDRSLGEQGMIYPREIRIRVVPGPQEEAFTEDGIKNFYMESYKVTMDSDRMGLRLEGREISHQGPAEIISDGIAMGAIQIPGHGMPIIMMADRQTAGGYPKIGNVITADLSKLAQAKPGDTLYFKKVSVKEAQKIFWQREEQFKGMQYALDHGAEKFCNRKEESLKPGQKEFRIRVNEREYTVLVEEKRKL
ncbi:biotin-dependent carboxyltransferase family protein [Isachenkonia alkalipeptolytica]|uniref:Biotin-dependent carboxyltransferase family protein n=1 Tax=Isachenkonia alkalipeptolytica TaxID=2565777 RepID=A0AA44BE77_9CLOT|nr:biotin-dependent carboxyltransferase family protein [Isachenkonia alkalipeptolytica]